MEPQPARKAVLEIDKRLESLLGCPVQVRAELVLPKGSHGQTLTKPIEGSNLILPDGTRVDGAPIYVEGVLTEFRRSVAIVWVELDCLPMEGTVDGRIQPIAGDAVFGFTHFLHDELPGPGTGGRVAGFPVDPGQVEAEGGVFFVLVLGLNQTLGLVLVGSAERLLFSGLAVLAVIDAPSAAEEAEACFHVMIHGYEHESARRHSVSQEWARTGRDNPRG